MKIFTNYFSDKKCFPNRISKIAWVVLFVSMFFLVETLGILPMMFKQSGEEYQPPKELNSLALVGVIGGMTFYAIERSKNGQK